MAEIKITAEPRANFGKGAARQLRREGKIPAVLYGHKQEPVHLSLPEHDLFLALKNSNVLLSLDIVGGTSELAIPKAVSKDPVKRTLEHIDLLLVRRGEKVTVDIPVTVTGEVAPDGLLDQQLVQIAVEAEATNIPPGIEVDIEGMQIGASVHAGDLKLPDGVSLAVEPDILVLHVIAAPTAEQMEAELGLPEPEVAEAEGVPAAPVAPAAAGEGEQPEAPAESPSD